MTAVGRTSAIGEKRRNRDLEPALGLSPVLREQVAEPPRDPKPVPSTGIAVRLGTNWLLAMVLGTFTAPVASSKTGAATYASPFSKKSCTYTFRLEAELSLSEICAAI